MMYTFALKFYSLMQNNFSGNFEIKYFDKCEQGLKTTDK